MADRLHPYPFFSEAHESVLKEVGAWLDAEPGIDHEDEDYCGQSRAFVKSLGRAGLIRHCVAAPDSNSGVDVRSICIVREALCYRSALSDSAFVTQGIAAAPIARYGTIAQKERLLPGVASGALIPAFALSEPDGGSDVSATSTTAARDGSHYVINGAKTWTSNAGIADFFIVIARTGEAPGAKGLSGFVVDIDTPGLTVQDQIVVSAPHPMASLKFENCRVPASAMLGAPGDGFRLAMSTLDIFRATVGAASVGIARRAYDETLRRISGRRLFGSLMRDMETVQMKIADMIVDLETATLAVYRAAWAKDNAPGDARMTAEASLAKLYASEAAFRVVDAAVQLFGGMGVTRGCIIERLARDVRPMRIYEGASEVQKLIIARHALRTYDASLKA